MKPIAIAQHDPHDGPAHFAVFLHRAGLPFRIFRLDQGDGLPASIRDYSGLCLLGGPMSVNDGLPYQAGQLALIQEAMAADLPVIGHCLGGQLMAKALGGRVTAAPAVEIGWSELELIDRAGARWFGGRERLSLFQWHNESFSIPSDGRWLLRGRHCANQAFSVGDKHLAMQFHVEVDAAKVRHWLDAGQDEIARSDSPGVQPVATLLADLDQAIEGSRRIADDLYAAWIEGLAR
ncbi:type 1 glutamine amidotransferase [Chitinimonas lacunae]|uniref:Type 1 glutamine amidotransferase n=1 Tax=Chitinimonas lacunae TaxID=1963018 RepID=A0ABV8MMP0_9NEIS